MAFPKPALIHTFLEEKRRNKACETQPLLSDDSIKSDCEKYNLLKSKNPKKKSSYKHQQRAKKEILEPENSSGSESSHSYSNRESEFKKSDSSGSLHSNSNTTDAKMTCTNYGGTGKVELHCAEVLASYGGIQASSGDKREPDRLIENLREASSFQKNIDGYDTPIMSYRNNQSFIETENDIDHDLYSYHEKKKDGNSSTSGPISQNPRFHFESDHCHDCSEERTEKEKKKRQKAMKKLLIATGLSFCFMVGEVVGGYLANSLAIMTDASHLLTDVSSFMISILAIKMASRPISKKMTFGWHRAEVIGALISVLAIWIVTGVLVYLAVMRLITNQYRVNGKDMLITAGIAVGFNILMGLVLHEHGHGHSHGHSHGHKHDQESGNNKTESCGDSTESGNVNVRAAFIHVIGDLLQSIGVLTAAIIIYFKPEYKIADPICTFLFSLFVLITTITILRDTVVIIMEGSPVNVDYNTVKKKLLDVDGIIAIHDLRLWSLTLNQTVMTAHLVINPISNPNSTLKRATKKLKSFHDFHSVTLQVEYYCDDMDECKKCKTA